MAHRAFEDTDPVVKHDTESLQRAPTEPVQNPNNTEGVEVKPISISGASQLTPGKVSKVKLSGITAKEGSQIFVIVRTAGDGQSQPQPLGDPAPVETTPDGQHQFTLTEEARGHSAVELFVKIVEKDVHGQIVATPIVEYHPITCGITAGDEELSQPQETQDHPTPFQHPAHEPFLGAQSDTVDGYPDDYDSSEGSSFGLSESPSFATTESNPSVRAPAGDEELSQPQETQGHPVPSQHPAHEDNHWLQDNDWTYLQIEPANDEDPAELVGQMLDEASKHDVTSGRCCFLECILKSYNDIPDLCVLAHAVNLSARRVFEVQTNPHEDCFTSATDQCGESDDPALFFSREAHRRWDLFKLAHQVQSRGPVVLFSVRARATSSPPGRRTYGPNGGARQWSH